jgi:hypothetical protein
VFAPVFSNIIAVLRFASLSGSDDPAIDNLLKKKH